MGYNNKPSILPVDHDYFFNKSISLVEWLRQYSKTEEEREEVFIRGFLGKMLLVEMKL